MEKVVIAAAKRTPIGKINGALKNFTSVDLGTIVTKAVIEQANIKPSDVDQVVFGNVIQAGAGQNISRQIEINSNIPYCSTANTVNQVCGSGLKAVRNAQAAIVMGDADVVIAGGVESMSNAPFLNMDVRSGHKFGDVTLVDSLNNDALMDAFNKQPMGVTAENVAEKFNVSREEQDEFAYQSHMKAAKAFDNGYFDKELVPIEIKNRKSSYIMKEDENIRRDTSIEVLNKLRPAFKEEGTVTAGNAASLNDGASALVLMSESAAKRLNVKPLAVIDGYAEAGCDPDYMGYAPYDATKSLFDKLNITMDDIDLVELNEAFAAQVLAVAHDYNIDMDKLNISGGAISMGHPLGDSGARIVGSLIYNLQRTNKKSGLATICIGGGMGMAMKITLL
ncbi:acetyl-CoA C-acetyltransferase [Apilactobacillus kunkeei]|uniref:acetyl-CoA C-acetyltransferase n=1 Tax=Apilactobacillus kunkeei EFB6 TaxID=1419324 RepID=A0A836YYU0_9LACO|nr:acetyl-CoA C-acetyltransferase [Apilactobacillus kunkeei]MBI0091632.1 acetyl-CoA C-acetyltransferase [Lactobacillus sp. M0345]KDB01466.1 acetyl-CoA acetyltransferase ThlA [Apilactobacillus kunkeei EFB6]MCX0326201.1 acetyl-CoA C-acetyltransferase [Apilactobacillus kunkeei]CAI2552099.1 Acetyl-CoA acetyltransferase [Apilactobacillus kunkeei]CAI2552505.1 Acetyl-CoA acetyltransferase [Apilactobacillus kunkeei]